MRRRKKASGKAVKAQRRKTLTLKRRNAPKAVGRRHSFDASVATDGALLTRERDEALEQQTATAEVLKVISRSTFDLQTVLATLVQSSGKLCQAENVQIFLCDGEFYRLAADNGFSPEYQEYTRQHPIKPGRNTLVARTALKVATVHIPDALADPEYTWLEGRRLGGYRTMLGVPLVRDGRCIGVLALTRSAVLPFTERQIELVETFADQAVIAIENTRLLNELRESLQQQTATADVLKTISRSTFDLNTVLYALAESAKRLCMSDQAYFYLLEGKSYRLAASCGFSPQAEALLKQHTIVPGRNTLVARTSLEGRVIHIEDVLTDPEYTYSEAQKLIGFRTLLGVPLLRAGTPIGVMTLSRCTVQPFTQKQIGLVSTFADQAVIAIENVRLFDEVQARTRDLTESLEQQTATSKILEVISNSPTDTQPAFDAIVRSGLNLFPDAVVAISLPDRDLVKLAAIGGTDEAGVEALRGRYPMPLSHEFITGTAILDRREIDLADAHEPPKDLTAGAQNLLAGGYRAMTVMPMMRGDETIGALNVIRRHPGPLSDKQRELLRTFANQAVIAIENTRLFNELRQRTDDLTEALDQQTATSEVLQVISRASGELVPVFEALLENAVRICGAKFGNLWLREKDRFRIAAMHGTPQAYADFIRSNESFKPDPRVGLGTITRTGQPFQVADVAAAPTHGDRTRQALIELAGARTLIGVPLLKGNEVIGAIGIYRQEVRSFTDRQIELVQNFAAQAVIAIENTRLLNELRESLQQQTATADVLKVISRSAFDLQTVLDTLLESAARLCRADRAAMRLLRDGAYQSVAIHGYSPEHIEYMKRHAAPIDRTSIAGRAVLEGKAIQVADVQSDPELTLLRSAPGFSNVRTLLGVPMLREGTPIGVLVLSRERVEPFTDKQIELVSTFADQAVIAIENVRLFDEVQARTRELAKSLDDLRSAQDRLVQTEKLASLGQLTAGIAHEIKNPLNFVNNFSGISAELITELQEALTDVALNEKRRVEITELMDTLRGNLDKVVQHGKRADAIVKNMLLHSREGSGEHRLVDINAMVEESLNLAWHGARAEKQGFNITLQRSFDPSAGAVDVFPQEVTRVLINLISNGFYATSQRKAEANGGDYEPTLTAGTQNLGDRVAISIRDNGTGIPPEVKEKIFNPFFTTKPAGEGTGLGLSISHDIIVKQHGGSIDVDTQPGEFTEIRIILPRTAAFLAESGGRV